MVPGSSPGGPTHGSLRGALPMRKIPIDEATPADIVRGFMGMTAVGRPLA